MIIPLVLWISSTDARSSNKLQEHDSGQDSCLSYAWWRHQMEKISALLALCEGNSPVTGEFPSQRPVAQSFHIFFDLRLNKRLSKQSWGWWFEMPSRSLWRHHNEHGSGQDSYLSYGWTQRVIRRCWRATHMSKIESQWFDMIGYQHSSPNNDPRWHALWSDCRPFAPIITHSGWVYTHVIYFNWHLLQMSSLYTTSYRS